MEWEFLGSDVECIESVCAVCAVFEEVFFRFCMFFAAFVFGETAAVRFTMTSLRSEGGRDRNWGCLGSILAIVTIVLLAFLAMMILGAAVA